MVCEAATAQKVLGREVTVACAEPSGSLVADGEAMSWGPTTRHPVTEVQDHLAGTETPRGSSACLAALTVKGWQGGRGDCGKGTPGTQTRLSALQMLLRLEEPLGGFGFKCRLFP